MAMKSKRASIFAYILLLGLVLFLLFNFRTTFETMSDMLGGDSNILLFSIAISIVDFAGLARLFTPETDMSDESTFIWIMLFVWLVAAGVDIILTAWWVAIRMEAAGTSGMLPSFFGNWMIVVFPWAVAFMEFAIRVPLVLLVGQYGDKLLQGFPRVPFRPGQKSMPSWAKPTIRPKPKPIPRPAP